jgi:hypothetical protein
MSEVVLRLDQPLIREMVRHPEQRQLKKRRLHVQRGRRVEVGRSIEVLKFRKRMTVQVIWCNAGSVQKGLRRIESQFTNEVVSR